MSRERPIIFSAPLIPKLLDGSKTQTRRIVKPQPPPIRSIGMINAAYCGDKNLWLCDGNVALCRYEIGVTEWRCPYGVPGDRLWVREAWVPPNHTLGEPEMHAACYRATNQYPDMLRWQSPLFMPRKYSRIILELTDVRVERVQDITVADAYAEGCEATCTTDRHHTYVGHESARGHFKKLWDSIYTDQPEKQWDKNLWVWALTFRRIE